MRVVVPQITWHSRDPVLSVDFDPSCKPETDGFYRAASGGGDCSLLVWRVSSVHNSFKPDVKCVAELKRHEKPINIVRFSPSGKMIATGGDDSYIILWRADDKIGTPETGEKWSFEKNLRKHVEDVSDLSWSPCGTFLISASIDNSAVLWDIKKGHSLHQWSEKEHTGFVHGVAYDPKNEFAVTMCIDRNLRFFDLKTKKLCHKALKYGEPWIDPSNSATVENREEKENSQNGKTSGQQANVQNSPTGLQESNTKVASVDKKNQPPPAKRSKAAATDRLFHDEFLSTFCRRLSFSPNGELLLVPAGLLPNAKSSNGPGGSGSSACKKSNAVVVFCRHSWTTPCALIPTVDSYSIATKWCPVYFNRNRELHSYKNDVVLPNKNERSYASIAKIAPPRGETREEAVMRMPYRLVYAVATNDSILIGDTASCEPLALVRSIHLARITDISWSPDGRVLMTSSTDGYCSIISFEDRELGIPYVPTYQPSLVDLAMKNNPENKESAPEVKRLPHGLPELTKECFPILAPEIKIKATPVRKTNPKGKKSTTPQSNTKKKSEGNKETDSKKKEGASQRDIEEAVRKMQKANKKVSPAPDTAKTSGNNVSNTITEKTAKKAEKPKKDKVEQKVKVSEGNSGSSNQRSPKSGTISAKVTPQRTTLDRWFKKESPASPMAPSPTSSVKKTIPEPKPVTVIKSDPELIVLDDDSNDTEIEKRQSTTSTSLSSTKAETKFPMTPPISTKRLSSKRSSSTPKNSNAAPLPHSVSVGKQPTGGLSPLEVHKLTTAPIKCRDKLAEDPEIVLQSSQERKVNKNKSGTGSTKNATTVAALPKSPVSSTSTAGSSKAPRRIQLITLNDANDGASKEGSLD